MLTVAVALFIVNLGIMAVMAIPVSLVFHAEWAEPRRTRWRVRWLFGLVDVESGHSGDRRREPAPRRRRTPSPPEPRPRQRRWRGLAVAQAFIRTEGFARRVLRLLGDLGRLARPEHVYAHAAFGLDDPADTGQLYGLLAPACQVATAAGFDVSCQPRFVEPGFAGSCGGRLQVRPISLVNALARFLGSPPTLRAMAAAWATRR